jgi:cytochrome c-type biogenesis protein CcmH
VALFVTGGAVGLYEELGAPRVSDVVFKAPPATASAVPGGAVAARHADLARAADHLADKLKADPSNGELWLLFARISSRLRHVDTAVDAYRHALALGMDDPQVQVGLGEVLVLQADGIVTPAAQDAFKVVVKADPKDAVARYYLALAVGQAGKAEAAIGLMQGLLADIPEDAPLRDQIIRRIGELARASGVAMPAVAKGVPAVEPSRAAEAMGSAAPVVQGAQTAMVTAMVSKLAARLEVEPEDFDGWMQLGRGYAVLRETDKAADAYERAVALVPGDVASRLQAVEGLLAGVKPDDPVPPRVVALLRQVEAISPDEPEVLWYLGVVAAQDGRPGAARRYWERLLARLPIEGENTEMVKAAMAGLKGG